LIKTNHSSSAIFAIKLNNRTINLGLKLRKCSSIAHREPKKNMR
jgi:hypothetical protein